MVHSIIDVWGYDRKFCSSFPSITQKHKVMKIYQSSEETGHTYLFVTKLFTANNKKH